jgi:hypothetical protein
MVSAAHELQRERDAAVVVHARFGDDEARLGRADRAVADVHVRAIVSARHTLGQLHSTAHTCTRARTDKCSVCACLGVARATCKSNG